MWHEINKELDMFLETTRLLTVNEFHRDEKYTTKQLIIKTKFGFILYVYFPLNEPIKITSFTKVPEEIILNLET